MTNFVGFMQITLNKKKETLAQTYPYKVDEVEIRLDNRVIISLGRYKLQKELDMW